MFSYFFFQRWQISNDPDSSKAFAFCYGNVACPEETGPDWQFLDSSEWIPDPQIEITCQERTSDSKGNLEAEMNAKWLNANSKKCHDRGKGTFAHLVLHIHRLQILGPEALQSSRN